MLVCFLMIRRPPVLTRTERPLPYPTLFRSADLPAFDHLDQAARRPCPGDPDLSRCAAGRPAAGRRARTAIGQCASAHPPDRRFSDGDDSWHPRRAEPAPLSVSLVAAGGAARQDLGDEAAHTEPGAKLRQA